MSLKQSIVITNEFTVKTPNGGTRGGTPGKYLERYMARDEAAEFLLPIYGTSLDDYVDVYMMREDAVMSADSEAEAIAKVRDVRDGIAFTDGNTSLSNSHVKELSKTVQEAFDSGKTVFKTVISFDDDYLRERGVLEPEYEAKVRGDHRGHVDQMKLRCAITEGMNRLSDRFDNLLWIGVIQFDTMHVHCHIVAVDQGEGRLRPDGEQAGKLTDRDKAVMRRGIDTFLDQSKTLSLYAKNVDSERAFARATVESYVREQEAVERLPQLIRAALPDNKNWWRAGSRRTEMLRANELARQYVTTILDDQNSGYAKALASIEDYADWRHDNEGLSDFERDELVRRGTRRLQEDCVNGIYRVFREYDDNAGGSVTSPMIDALAKDINTLADEADDDYVSGFGYRLRTYSTRANYHRQERDRYHDARVSYESAAREERVSAASQAAYEFYLFEEAYQAKCLSKYQYLLPIDFNYSEWMDELEELRKNRLYVEQFEMLLGDKGLSAMPHDMAESYGFDRYGIEGASQLRENPELLIARYREAQVDYEQHLETLTYKLHGQGLDIEWRGTGEMLTPSLVIKPEYDFDDVKALDLHHMSKDFPTARHVSPNNVDAFVRTTNERVAKLQSAIEYFRSTGQGKLAEELPIDDCIRMSVLSQELSETAVLESSRGVSNGIVEHLTSIPLDSDFEHDLRNEVRGIITSVNAEVGTGLEA